MNSYQSEKMRAAGKKRSEAMRGVDRGGDVHRDAIVAAFRAAWAKGEPFPTLRRIGEIVGLASTATTSYHLRVLVARGTLTKTAYGRYGYTPRPGETVTLNGQD